MTTARCSRMVAALAAAALASGCAQTGPIFPRRTTMGSLKASVSHLEYENDQLRHQLTKVESEKREAEDRLSQEEWTNGDLAKRLDDARLELGQRGVDIGGAGESARTLPAGRSTRKRRKAPFAQIPGRIESAPPSDPADDAASVSPRDGDRGAQSALDPELWLPIAQGTKKPAKKVR